MLQQIIKIINFLKKYEKISDEEHIRYKEAIIDEYSNSKQECNEVPKYENFFLMTIHQG